MSDTFAELQTTALMTSSFHGHTEIVRLLLRRGADVKAVDIQSSTALGYAFGGKHRTKGVASWSWVSLQGLGGPCGPGLG